MLRNNLYRPWFLNDKRWGFEVIDGEYSGVVVQIEKLEFKEGSDDGNLDVEYHIINKPEIIAEENVKGDLFKSVFELIVNDIVKEAIETLDDKVGNDNTKEPDPQ